jgi:pseudouridine kinase
MPVNEIVCIGGACIDRKYHVLAQARPGTSNPARAQIGFGGVARNVAENLARLGVNVALITALGNDQNAAALLHHTKLAGVDASRIIRNATFPTSEYAAVIGTGGELLIGAAETRAIDAMQIEDLQERWSGVAASRWVFVDCNVPEHVLAWCIERARGSGVRVAIDAVSEAKVQRLPQDLSGIDLLILNEMEARASTTAGARAVIVTRGSQGLLVNGSVQLPAVSANCVDVTGAGDALAAGVLYALLRGDDLIDAARIGALCAALTIESPASVRPDLSPALLDSQRQRLEACTVT